MFKKEPCQSCCPVGGSGPGPGSSWAGCWHTQPLPSDFGRSPGGAGGAGGRACAVLAGVKSSAENPGVLEPDMRHRGKTLLARGIVLRML